jgi:hypothetical protein
MKSKLIAVASAAIIGLTAVAIPNEVEARSRGWWIPGAIVGGLALGAIASSAYRPYYYGPGPYYGYGYGPYAGPYTYEYSPYDYGPYEFGPAYYGGTHYYYQRGYERPYRHWTEY